MIKNLFQDFLKLKRNLIFNHFYKFNQSAFNYKSKNLYDILGVSPQSDMKEIKSSYYKLAF